MPLRRRRLAQNRLPVAPPPLRSRAHSPSARSREDSLARVRRVAREHQASERPFEPEKRGSWRGRSGDLVVNPSHRRNAVSGGRDRFEDLAQGRFYDIDAEHEGARRISYSQANVDKNGDWWASEYTGGSDYSGGTVHLNNYNQLCEMAGELEAEYGHDFYVTARGGHGTYEIFWNVNKTPDEIVEVLAALEDYPSVDDESLSALEHEQVEEAWNNWGESEFRTGLERHLGGSADDVTAEDLWVCFSEAAEASNSYWEDQDGGGMWINMKRVLAKVQEPPPGFVVND